MFHHSKVAWYLYSLISREIHGWAWFGGWNLIFDGISSTKPGPKTSQNNEASNQWKSWISVISVGFRTTNDWSNCTSHLRWLQPRTEFPAILLSQPPGPSCRDCEAKMSPSAVFLRKNKDIWFWLLISEAKIQRLIYSVYSTPSETKSGRRLRGLQTIERLQSGRAQVSWYDGVPRSNVQMSCLSQNRTSKWLEPQE